MKHKNNNCNFGRLSIEYSWAILLANSLAIIFFCGDASWSIRLLNISYSIFAAALFDLFLVYIPNDFFLLNLNAARLACRQLGIKDTDFYQALSEYSVSLQA